jgi:hypothetical protein
MKSLFKLLLIVACSFTLFVSCKKDGSDMSCDGKGAFHYSNYSGNYVLITVDEIDYGAIANGKALEIPLRVGTFHYLIFASNQYGYQGALIKEGDVTIEECEAVYAS